jgi:hypothetical protein
MARVILEKLFWSVCLESRAGRESLACTQDFQLAAAFSKEHLPLPEARRVAQKFAGIASRDTA